MELKKKIKEDFMVAYKAKDFNKKNFLGVIIGAIETNETKSQKIEPTDNNVVKLLKSFEKGLNETLESNKKLGLDYSTQEAELGYLEPYLSEMMGEDEVRLIVKSLINDTGNKNSGALMGLFNKMNKDKAFDNKIVSVIVNEELSLIQ